MDRDEALIEAVAELHGSTRAGFLRTAALGGAGLLSALAAPPAATAQLNDVAILNFGLRFERLQATFYTQADELGTIAAMADAKRQWARTLGAHERAHVRIIKQVLGPKAGPRPSFDFGDANATDAAFTRTAVAMEDLTVALLTGIVPAVQDRGLDRGPARPPDRRGAARRVGPQPRRRGTGAGGVRPAEVAATPCRARSRGRASSWSSRR